jgi:hypothetical protein
LEIFGHRVEGLILRIALYPHDESDTVQEMSASMYVPTALAKGSNAKFKGVIGSIGGGWHSPSLHLAQTHTSSQNL